MRWRRPAKIELVKCRWFYDELCRYANQWSPSCRIGRIGTSRGATRRDDWAKGIKMKELLSVLPSGRISTRTFALLAALSAPAACQATTTRELPAPKTIPYQLSNEDLAAVKRDLPERLKDPSSALFGAMSGSIDTAGVVKVCGYVNARNSFGGYTGQQPFTGILASNREGKRVFAVTGIGDGSYGSIAILALCQRNGITL